MRIITALLLILSFPVITLAQGLTLELQQQAKDYRARGLELQQSGDLNSAMSFYRKAVELDPLYAQAYNDIGVLYEIGADMNKAEENYLRAVSIDKNYLGAYSNLALLYEEKRDLQKASLYWKKRAELGFEDDPWTKKAKNRIKELAEVMPSLKEDQLQPQVLELVSQIKEQKKIKKSEDLQEAEKHLVLAKRFYAQSGYKDAVNEAALCLSFDPGNEEAIALMDKATSKLRAAQKQESIEKMRAYFETGMTHYQMNNLSAAKQEFDKIEEFAYAPKNN
jgi:tetratricopeptide (TPR) repeat protein